MLHTKYQDSMPCGFRQEYLFMFSLYNKYKTCDPWGGDPLGEIIFMFSLYKKVSD